MNTDFAIFLNAVEKSTERRGILGDDEIVFPPSEDFVYGCTPRNALIFGVMGVDGVHYAILKLDGAVQDDSPVIQVAPMDGEPYTVLGDSFLSYLAAACAAPIPAMSAVFQEERSGRDKLISFLKERFKHSRLFKEERLRKLDRYLKLIEPRNDC